ncbi:hypothetical protein NZNM25_01510 [Nitrosopumilus zosterae]|uniref:Uncharacterized protein n=1 Tax=Nitrosopumilus zosterae TaxID=718286 RepID=A0A2S2KNW2_9ARCH|nr:hypothetical protein [Nitrosopumilus zosterae]BDQ31147.1 hypothetical protein NZOSNM25_001258 [Nitrosopumilus zosterae]GBH33360.1 hypothetical protein NZNM25_01510 [Nitrosopumilus zosterae]
MSQYRSIQKIILKNLPEVQQMPSQKRKKVLKNFLRGIITEVVKKVNLPDPLEIKSKIIKEQYLDKRRPKGHKKGEWKLDYNLWRMLYEAKLELNMRIDQNQIQEVGNMINYADYSSYDNGYLDNGDSLSQLIQASNSTTTAKQTHILRMDESLEKKTVNNRTYQKFVGAIDTALRTQSTIKLGQANFYLYEKTDLENNRWLKLILDVEILHDSFENKMTKWEMLRNVIDTEIKTIDIDKNSDELDILKKSFYINMVF